MATSEVLLVEPVDGLGNEGEQVKVKAGYARNYLLPLKKAVPINRANRKQMEALVKRREQRLIRELETSQEVAKKIAALSLTFAVKTGQGGKLFGSITNQDLHAKLAESGFEVDRHKIHLENPVKELGKHNASVKLHPEVTAEFSFEVFSENPIETEEGEDSATEEATAES